MINAEAAMLSTHPCDLVDHVETRLWNLRPRVLLGDHLPDLLVFAVLDVEEALFGDSPHFKSLFLLQVFGHKGVCFHGSVVVLMHEVVALCKCGALRAARQDSTTRHMRGGLPVGGVQVKG